MENFENTEQPEQNNGQDNEHDRAVKLHGYKVVCLKLGASMWVYFICRLLAGWILHQLTGLSDTISESMYSLIYPVVSITLVYIIPLLFTAFLFSSFTNYSGNFKELYRKPKRLARAMGTFPATFGFGYGVALLTLLIAFLLSRFLGGNTYIEDLLTPASVELSTNIISVIAIFFMMVVVAPLFEEFWVRGIMYDALKPYGTGMAIIISSILFGLMHGNLYMLFYTTAFGFALGYVRYATGSLFIVTILHAIVNAIGAGTLIFTVLMEITNEEVRLLNTFYIIYLLAFLVLIVIGIVVFISKIPKIRKYTFENPWTDIGPWKKTALFFISLPVILMFVLAFNELSGGLIWKLIIRQ